VPAIRPTSWTNPNTRAVQIEMPAILNSAAITQMLPGP
jgi:hypothetical protein